MLLANKIPHAPLAIAQVAKYAMVYKLSQNLEVMYHTSAVPTTIRHARLTEGVIAIMAIRSRKILAGFGILAFTGSLVLTGCADEGDCDSMGTQQRSIQEIALAGSSTEVDNFVELPNFGSQSFAIQANTQADGDTQVLADDCDDDDDGEDD
jgi:hypothetical protein